MKTLNCGEGLRSIPIPSISVLIFLFLLQLLTQSTKSGDGVCGDGVCVGGGGLLLDNLPFYVYLRKIIAAKNSGGGAAYNFFRLYILLYFDF